jgi:tyrosyl-tRNA synthetase
MAEALSRHTLITRNLKEVTGAVGELDTLLSEKEHPVVYWGTATTGAPHIAYLLPMLKIRDLLLAGCHVKILLADLHAVMDAMKSSFEQVEIRTKYYKLLLTELLRIVGADPIKVEFVIGSEIQLTPAYFKDVLRINALVTTDQATHAGSDVVKQALVKKIKPEAVEKPPPVTMNSLLYPSLQALDEEYLGCDIQLGGNDQRKIFMHARKFMPRLGYKKRIHLMTPMLASLNGGPDEKMSSSEANTKIDLLDDITLIQKKITKAFCEDRNVDNNPILALYEMVLRVNDHTPDITKLRDDFKIGVLTPQTLKQNLINDLTRILEPLRANKGLVELRRQAYA